MVQVQRYVLHHFIGLFFKVFAQKPTGTLHPRLGLIALSLRFSLWCRNFPPAD